MTEWSFWTRHGTEVNPNGVIFPLISIEEQSGPCHLIGTAFMIAKPGVFLTARHCLYKDPRNSDPFRDLTGLVHHALHVKWSTYVDGSDVAIGQLEMPEVSCSECADHKVMTLCTWTPIESEIVLHWGCEQSVIGVKELAGSEYHLECQLQVSGHRGYFIERKEKYPPFTDNPCHVTSAVIPPGASGGPVSLSTGQVCAISSTSNERGGYSTASLVKDALDAMIPPHFRLRGEARGRRQTFGELLAEFGLEVFRGD